MSKTTESGRHVDRAKLIFHHYGSEYFLAEMWTGETVRTFPVHPREQLLGSKDRSDS